MPAPISHRQTEVWVAGLLCSAALMLTSFAWQYLQLQQLLQPLPTQIPLSAFTCTRE